MEQETLRLAAIENAKVHYIGSISDELISDAVIDFEKGFEYANKSKWVDVNLALPAKNMKVKWICEDGKEDVGFYNKERESFETIDPRSDNKITHWQRLIVDLKNKNK